MSISPWDDLNWNQEELAFRKRLRHGNGHRAHPAMFPIALPQRVISFFLAGEEQLVLDPFLGSGSTTFAAMLMGHRSVGCEIRRDYCDLIQERTPYYRTLSSSQHDAYVVQHTAERLLEFVAPETVGLAVTSPPYWSIMSRKRSADKREIRDYTALRDASSDLTAVEDYGTFLVRLAVIFNRVYQTLRPGAYCIVNCMDLRVESMFYPFHSDLAAALVREGFQYQDLIVWDRRKMYNSLRPLGYPYRPLINRCHEYLLVMQRPK